MVSRLPVMARVLYPLLARKQEAVDESMVAAWPSVRPMVQAQGSCAGWWPYAVGSTELLHTQELMMQLCCACLFGATGESVQVLVVVCQQAEGAASDAGTHVGQNAAAAGCQGL